MKQVTNIAYPVLLFGQSLRSGRSADVESKGLGGGAWRATTNRRGFPFMVTECLEWDMGDFAQHGDYTKNYWMVHFRMLSAVVGELYLFSK